MNRDRYPELGDKQRVASFEAALALVRTQYPSAYAEGSTGAERTFWVQGELVGHVWPVRPRDEAAGFWLRLLPLEGT